MPEHPLRRASDRSRLSRVARWIIGRDGAMFLAIGLAGYASWHGYTLATQIQDGRRASSGITCAVASAVSDQGKKIVVQSAAAPTPPKLEAFLRKYGYPTKAQRQVAAAIAGQQYVTGIANEIRSKIGRKADQILNADGTLNCAQVAKIARIPH